MTGLLSAFVAGFAVAFVIFEVRHRWMVVAFRHEIIAVLAERDHWAKLARERPR